MADNIIHENPINREIPNEENRIVYALSKTDNVLLHIDEVTNGSSCNCICPACKTDMQARQGKKNFHTFAHNSKQKCKFYYESTLIYWIKDILEYKYN